MESNFTTKSFHAPVLACDLRPDQAKSTMSSFHQNHLQIKQEGVKFEQFKVIDHPLDYSEVQIAQPASDSETVYPKMPPLIRKSDQYERNL